MNINLQNYPNYELNNICRIIFERSNTFFYQVEILMNLTLLYFVVQNDCLGGPLGMCVQDSDHELYRH